MVFFNILINIIKVVNISAVLLGLYGWIWYPRFLNGQWPGPYWLMWIYDAGIFIMLGVAVISLGIVLLYRFVVGIFTPAAPLSLIFKNLLIWAVFLLLIAGIPTAFNSITTLQSEQFNNNVYHLSMVGNGQLITYSVFECVDPLSIMCRQIAQSPPVPPPPPPPPSPSGRTEVVMGTPVFIPPPALPTMTPPAQLITDTTGETVLAVQVGTNFQPVAAVDDSLLTPAPPATPTPQIAP